ncbi:protein of unknown function [Flagellimonas flava]|uniref:DUF4249 domain-containing protein n=2 Tax=Flagellimonas flava TaxID=570519 RepID=A0A1M5IF55_9FLAO|nr:protein of unknown function [Allomuricauda flava]
MRKWVKTYLSRCSIFLMLICYGCIEPFNAVFEDFQSALVIEGTITNELKLHQIVLTRTYEFEADGPSPETTANVRIIAGDGTTFSFEHVGDGVYVPSEAFAAQFGVDYQLEVDTQDGKSYASEVVQLTSSTSIDDIRAERIINDDGQDGMGIFIDSFDPTGSSVNYRYEFIETYRVIAPEWFSDSLIGDPEGGCGVIRIPNRTDARICYPTDFSNALILTSTANLNEDRVSNFMVRFVNRNNYIISHRYSILVRQFVESNDAYTFFETLNEFSGSESLLSQTQPGFLQGNIFSKDDEDEKVLGFFNASSVSEKRLFFNYDDFYPGERLPPYVEDCKPSSPPIASTGGCIIRPILEAGIGVYAGDNPEPRVGQGPYFIVSRVCGDCSVLGPEEQPDFWIE